MKNKRKRNWIIAGVILLLIALVMWLTKDKKERHVQAELPVVRTIIEKVSASGKVQPSSEVKIQSDVSGQIVALPVKEGDHVVKGQLLVRINPDLYTSALQRAEATLNSSKSNLSSAKARLLQAQAQSKLQELTFKRNEKLFAEKAISIAEMDNARSVFETANAEVSAAVESVKSAEFSIASAEASRNEAADNLKRTTILSPIDGTVTALTKEVGEAVLGNNMTSGDVIMKISGLSNMEVNVEVNESDIVRVQLGDTAIVAVDAFRNEKFKGIVTEIGNTALNLMTTGSMAGSTNNQVTNFSVKISILPQSYQHLVQSGGTDSPFRPGMTATVDILSEKVEQVMSIPIKAVTTRSDSLKTDEMKTCVFVLDANGKAKVKYVKTGVQDDQFIHVLEGISKDEQVITGPYDEVAKTLNNGDEVTIGDIELKAEK
jgi:HlyD family secretion protein